jgi:hypothetical protein
VQNAKRDNPDMASPEKQAPLEPEVLPPEPQNPPRRTAAERAFGPVVAGMIIDVIDFATFGPLGLMFGLVFGGGVAWYICSLYGLTFKQKLAWSLAAGIYCTIPGTEFIPVGTMVGACVRYWELKADARDRQNPPAPPQSPVGTPTA